MTEPTFLVLSTIAKPADQWLEFWAKRYTDYETKNEADIYRELIDKQDNLSSNDFVVMGKWKDNALGETRRNRWKENVAMVAYRGWIRAAAELPKCPTTESAVKVFLQEWSEWKYRDSSSRSADKMKRFGLSRASTMLHFISGGRYPIFDERVRVAIERLSGKELGMTIEEYLNDVCPFVENLSHLCGCRDVRKLDNALFAYGASPELGQLMKSA